MKKKLLMITFTAALTACSPVSGQNAAAASIDIPHTQASPVVTIGQTREATPESITQTEETAQETIVQTTAAAVTIDEARQIFTRQHPGVPIEIAKQEGDVYYIQGYSGNNIYKMKIDIMSGEIYLNKTIQTGRR